ncbi:MAG: hydroxymethylglutaryl-CoA reductase, degradative [Candidatus Diapherotrites archaeon]
MNSELSGFYKLSIEERQKKLIDSGIAKEEIDKINNFGSLGKENADRMIENVIGGITFPIGIAVNFVINGKPVLIPMATEESSIVAAASKAAKLSSGFEAKAEDSLMIGQILLTEVKEKKAVELIKEKEKELIEFISGNDSILEKLGGGAKKITAKKLKEKWIEVHLIVDCKDAMGANTVNSLLEKLAPKLEELTQGTALMKIISNNAIYRKVKAKAVWKKEKLNENRNEAEKIIQSIIEANEFAKLSEFRAATHNKGIMNGIDAVAIATGNDFRAIEAGVHCFACREGKYMPVTKYYKDAEGNLIGEIEIPIQIGIVGGATKVNPSASACIKLMEINNVKELECIMACVGLAQNFAAMNAITTEGIQKGHMRLHAKNIAFNAGAKGKEIEKTAEKMISEKNISQGNAEKIIKEMRGK